MNDYKIPLHPHWIPFNDGQIPILNVESPIHQFSIYPHVGGQSPSLPPLREGRAREGPQTWRCRPAWAAPLRVSRTPGRWNSATFRASPIHGDSICHMYLGIMWADIYIYIHTYWLVVYLPLWKMMDFASWDDEIPNIWENKKCSKPPTSIYNWIHGNTR